LWLAVGGVLESGGDSKVGDRAPDIAASLASVFLILVVVDVIVVVVRATAAGATGSVSGNLSEDWCCRENVGLNGSSGVFVSSKSEWRSRAVNGLFEVT